MKKGVGNRYARRFEGLEEIVQKVRSLSASILGPIGSWVGAKKLLKPLSASP